MDTHEIGFKNSPTLNLNSQFSIFTASYQDKQETAVPFDADALTATGVQNIGDATIRGAEWQVQGKLTEQLNLNFNLGFLDAFWEQIDGGGATGANGIDILKVDILSYLKEGDSYGRT